MQQDWTSEPKKVKAFLQQTFKRDKHGLNTGSLLQDSQMLLDFVTTGEVTVSARKQLFSMNFLAEINAKMQQPLHLGLKRPVQSSYPHIKALYLLLQSLGFFEIDYSLNPNKPTLKLNPTVLKSWQGLNPIERYFTLLHAWFFKLEQRAYRGATSLHLLRRWTKEKKIDFDGFKPFKSDFNSIYMLHLALLELFGWVTLEHGTSAVGESWWVKKIRLTDLSIALSLLISGADQPDNDGMEIELLMFENEPLDAFQQRIQRYFPQWQRHLALPEIEIFVNGIHVFKVSLDKVWRRLAVPTQSSWAELADAILAAFDFDTDHLYHFEYPSHFGGYRQIHHPFMDEQPCVDDVAIGELGLTKGCYLEFIYDYGAEWPFHLLLEDIKDEEIADIQILAQQGDAPAQYDSAQDE